MSTIPPDDRRVATVTGGARGLGLAIGQRMSRYGIRCALRYVDLERATLWAVTLPDARTYRTDVADCVAPAAIDTEIIDQVTPEFKAAVIAKIPMGWLGRPEEVAHLVNWLASEECSFCTGAVFDVSGGRATY